MYYLIVCIRVQFYKILYNRPFREGVTCHAVYKISPNHIQCQSEHRFLISNSILTTWQIPRGKPKWKSRVHFRLRSFLRLIGIHKQSLLKESISESEMKSVNLKSASVVGSRGSSVKVIWYVLVTKRWFWFYYWMSATSAFTSQ